MIKWFKKIFHPLFALIGIQLVWVLVVFFWVYWFIGRHREFTELAERYKLDLAEQGLDWMVLVEGIALLLVILAGVYVIFIYWKRQSYLYREQRNSISQVTHELKSPLASIQLHLETIKLRRLQPDKLERFVDTMLSDIDRLNSLTSNLMMAAKLEHKYRPAHRKLIDFSSFVKRLMEQKKSKLPEGGSLNIDIQDGVHASVNEEAMETVLRNLFENSVLYSISAPEITVRLEKHGRHCLIEFEDKGKGIEANDLKKIFRMFYRVRRPGESIRGSGLGLYIVKSIVTEHGGKISVSSEGNGKGCTFRIDLPVAH